MSRLSRTLGILVTILILPAAAAAQFPPAPPPLARGTAVIVGQVVDAATGKGVSNAIVSLGGTRRAMSTSDGRFAFRALPSGSHSLSAVRSGYIGGAYGMRRPDGPTLPVVLADGERRADIVILMWRHSSITGSIVDEAGEPVVGSRSLPCGERQLAADDASRKRELEPPMTAAFIASPGLRRATTQSG